MCQTDESCTFRNGGVQSEHALLGNCGIGTEWGLRSRRFLDSGSEENIVDPGEEFLPIDLKVDLTDSDNNIFSFIIVIRATRSINLFSFFYCVWTVPALLLRQRKIYDMTLWIINLTRTHWKLSKNVYVYCIIPSSLFTTISFKRAKTVRLQEPSVPFCGVLNELNRNTWTK